jgi:alpha-D-ribose 1-methylphosphonate 5-triphosphate synthase subunit PhnH
MTVQHLAQGFADPVRDAQAHFRAAMMALARPGTIERLETGLSPPAPLTPELAALALTLADHETLIWLDPPLAASEAVVEFLRFHTGARMTTEPEASSFALVSDAGAMPPLSDFAQGTDEYPDRSTTLVVAVDTLATGLGFRLEGPGIKGSASLKLDPVPANFLSQLRNNRAQFPRGVDCIFVAPGAVAALPRSVRIGEA